jgi:opacity protein-like surface antigen
MKCIAVGLIALLAGLSTTAVHAENDKGLYVGAGVGQFNLKVNNFNDIENAVQNFDSDDTSWKIFGGYRFNPYLALELDYIDFGGPSQSGASIGIKGFAPYVVGTLPLGIFELFAQVGYYFYDVDLSGGSSSISDFDGSQDDFVYAAGFGVLLFDHLDARLAYEIIDISEVKDSNAVWLTGAWRF